MAITFLEKRKRQRYMILVFIVVMLVTLTVIWLSFFKKEKPKPILPEEIIKPYKEVKINWPVLEDPQLQILEPFEKIPSFGEGVGRENPFISY